MTYILSLSLSVVKNNSLDPIIIIWIIAAPGVISQDCSPLAGGTGQKNGKVVPQWAPPSRGHGQQRRSIMGLESEGSRPPSRPGHREERLCAALSPSTSMTQVSVFGQAWLRAQGQSLPHIGARKDEPAQYLRGYFLSLLLISAMRFTSSTIRQFLASGDPAVFFLYFFPLNLTLLAITAVIGSYLCLL